MAEHGHPSHGNTVAAWTAVGILLVAALVMCVGVILASVTVFVIGAVLAVLGIVAGKVL
ncbi:MAG: HGxxPAAW family protein, partial [Angustibacter sp.]